MKALWTVTSCAAVASRIACAWRSSRASGHVGSTRSKESCTRPRPSSSRTSFAHSAGVTQRLTQNDRLTPKRSLIAVPRMVYFVAPIVSPRTMWRETRSAKIVTGSTMTVPVAMIFPHGSS